MQTGKPVAYRPDQEDVDLITAELKVKKKLSHLLDECATEEKERGYSPLRIGFPILVQENNSASTQCYSAPLFVWDMELREDRNGWTFIPSSEVPKRNASLEGLVSARNTELALEPLYGGSWEEGSLDGFAAGLEERIDAFLEANRKVTLSTDLINGPCLIPHRTKTELVTAEAKPFRLTLHPAMLLGKFREGKASIIRDLEAHGDALEDLTETPLETPAMGANLADPSQAGAIADLRTGKHIVLHGPPGTGKSQTITGAITSAIASGYRVAVVCQKLAALEVIEANLQELGHHEGIAKITNLSKDRRKIVDQVRARFEAMPDRLQHPGRVSTEGYEASGGRILTAKEIADSPLVGDSRFKDAVGRLGQLRRTLESTGESHLLRTPPKPAQLRTWTADLTTVLRKVEGLAASHRDIEPALAMEAWVTEAVRTASIGVDIDQIREKIQENAAIQVRLEQGKQAAGEAMRAAADAKEAHCESARAIWCDLSARLDALPRQIRPVGFGDNPLSEEIANVEHRMGRVAELEETLYQLERDPLFATYRNANGFQAWWKRLFSTPFKQMHARWTAHERALHDIQLIASDPLPELLGHMKAFRQALTETQSAFDAIPDWPDSPPESTLTAWSANIDALRKAASDPLDLGEGLGFDRELDELRALLDQSESLTEALNLHDWLSEKGIRQLASTKGPNTLEALAAQATRLAPMKSWADDCKALNLAASDFKGSVASWVEYHAVMHVLTQWDGIRFLLGSDGPIREVAREVTFLRNRINETVAKVIEHQFRKGANHIKDDPRVHSFKQEFLKTGKRKKTLRQLYHRHGQTMTRLFPVHLTTPEVVCNLFEGKDKTFDLVIFDEASQVELHDAVTCLLKGTSIVVAGDEHQMPPSHYFAARTDHLFEEDEEEMEGAIIEVESLLEFCQQHPGFSSRYLDFHYRSQHPLLIQFSNRAIYSRLVVKPNPTEYVPIQFVDVQGVWDNQHNSMEAERVIDILRTLPSGQPAPKILVATLNVRQRTEIQRLLRDAESADPEFQRAMAAYQEAGFGVKNLENLQGDECDILIISVGYGSKPGGRFSRNYGVINQKHGYRLLNVLVTRARIKVFLLNSIPEAAHRDFASELAVQSTWNRGLLHGYIQYAAAVQSGDAERIGHVLNTLSKFSRSQVQEVEAGDGLLESPFEEEVFEVLRGHFSEEEIQLQEPHMGFRMDMVLRPKSKPGLKIAIECDGATFHSGWENQLADHHREQLLKGAGYAFVRIWSRSWWSDSKQSARDLLADIDKAMQAWDPGRTGARTPAWCDAVEISSGIPRTSQVILEPEQEPPAQPVQPSEARQELKPPATAPSPAGSGQSGRSELMERTQQREKRPALHVLAPCMTTVSLTEGNQAGRTVKFIFLEAGGRSFLGRSRDQWNRLGKAASNLTVLGSESDIYIAFEGAEKGDEVTVKGNRFKIESIELDD